VTRAPGAALLALAAAGILLLLGGAALVWAGVAIPDLVRAQIPGAAPVDSAAVGGAMVALGGLAVLTGIAHLLLIPGIGRTRPTAVVAGIMGAATLCVVAIASGVGALVALAASAADAATMVPAAIGLSLVGAAYGWLAMVLVRVRNRSRPG